MVTFFFSRNAKHSSRQLKNFMNEIKEIDKHYKQTDQLMKKTLFILFTVTASMRSVCAKTCTQFCIKRQRFFIRWKTFQIIAGEIHYPRVPREPGVSACRWQSNGH
jgi:hypothetical protein